MRTLSLLALLCPLIPSHADYLDDPYRGYGRSQRRFDEILANSLIGPPPVDGDESAVRSYFYELENQDNARWRLQRDAEIRLRRLEERQEEIEEELEERELIEGVKGWRD